MARFRYKRREQVGGGEDEQMRKCAKMCRQCARSCHDWMCFAEILVLSPASRVGEP